MSFFTVVRSDDDDDDDDDECSAVEEVEVPSVIRLVLWLVLDGSNTSVVFALAWPANNARPISAYKYMFVDIHMMMMMMIMMVIKMMIMISMMCIYA